MKAFNTIFGVVLGQGRPLDVFLAGDDVRAKADVAAFIESLDLRPLDVGALHMAHWLEGMGLVVMGLARHGVGISTLPSAPPFPPEAHRPGPSRGRTGAPGAQTMVDGSPKGIPMNLVSHFPSSGPLSAAPLA